MSYRVVFSAIAEREADEWLEYLSQHDEMASAKYESALMRVVDFELATMPNAFSWFWLIGRPYRGRPFTVSRRTAFWLIYTVDDDNRIVAVQRFWNASRNPATFEL
jgi:hypothetical protein